MTDEVNDQNEKDNKSLSHPDDHHSFNRDTPRVPTDAIILPQFYGSFLGNGGRKKNSTEFQRNLSVTTILFNYSFIYQEFGRMFTTIVMKVCRSNVCVYVCVGKGGVGEYV